MTENIAKIALNIAVQARQTAALNGVNLAPGARACTTADSIDFCSIALTISQSPIELFNQQHPEDPFQPETDLLVSLPKPRDDQWIGGHTIARVRFPANTNTKK